MCCLNSTSPENLAVLATLVGVILASDLDANTQNSLGNFLEAVGQTILTIAAQEQCLATDESSKLEYERLQKQIEELSLEINALKKEE
ncbi:hypothetical protein BX659_102179 [Orenia metallireducens]|jgi:hypothetical protein|uniref:hypothetical protein n=1 Tax=Orenia metallireducens TaxID=1413210 RepID=UPI000D07E1A9|nr:hypothetical protein [Orenia metallireducens]PRX34862.1 hypothetical protein BX659_102179 [Orenia metallireducens]